ncbi:MAG: carboxypeptidase-like regulatory domain-containing protein, partial [Acidobacterium ailaaui]|nr:carboxypeptidase-like regulatory domain-containing protein [Pseudacidobacterium ailaaui]
MRFRLSTCAATLALLLGSGIVTPFRTQRAVAQTSISGDIQGTITDPTGAVVPNATISVKSLDTGAVQKASTNSAGSYRVSLLKPGRYQITASAAGFQNTTVQVVVNTGTITTGDLKLSVGSSAQTVEVSATSEPLIHTEDANLTTSFNQQQIQNMPNPGNDVTFMGQLAPGSIINTTTQATNGLFGYGNFSSFGLPATSNNFTINGTDENDPFFNINNSGATNLLLGNNEIAEATVISNAYAAQYGGLGGAKMNEITRSGSNAF